MKVARLHQVSLPVVDMQAAIRFYRDAIQLPLIAEYTEPVALAFFDIDGTRLMLETNLDASGTNGVLYLYVEDLESAVSEVKALGYEFESDPQAIHHDAEGRFGKAGETEMMAFIRDPSGNLISLVERKTLT